MTNNRAFNTLVDNVKLVSTSVVIQPPPRSFMAWWWKLGKFKPEHHSASITVYRFAMGIPHNGVVIHGGDDW